MDDSFASPASLLEQAHQVAAARGGTAHQPPRRDRPALRQRDIPAAPSSRPPGARTTPAPGPGLPRTRRR